MHHRLQIGSAWSSAQVADVAVHHPKQSGDRRLIRGDARWEAAISERIDRPSTLRRLLLYLFKVGGRRPDWTARCCQLPLTRFFSGCDQQTAAEVAQMKGQMVAVDQAANIGIQFQGERRQYEFSPDIKRTGKDPIPRSAFQNELFAGISGLISSRRAIGNLLGPPDDFIFVHNQAAERPIRRKWIKWVEEYLPVEDGKQLRRLKHRT